MYFDLTYLVHISFILCYFCLGLLLTAQDDTYLSLTSPLYMFVSDRFRVQSAVALAASELPTTPGGWSTRKQSLPHADVIYFCSPNNPTGAVATREQLEALVAYATKKVGQDPIPNRKRRSKFDVKQATRMTGRTSLSCMLVFVCVCVCVCACVSVVRETVDDGRIDEKLNKSSFVAVGCVVFVCYFLPGLHRCLRRRVRTLHPHPGSAQVHLRDRGVAVLLHRGWE